MAELLVPLSEIQEEYQKAVSRSPFATVFHRLEWLDTLRAALGGRIRILVHPDFYMPLHLKGLWPLRRVYSLDYDTYGGPVPRHRKATGPFQMTPLFGAWDLVRIVDFHGLLEPVPGMELIDAETQVIYARGGIGEVRQNYHRSLKKALRKARREGVQVETVRTEGQVAVFYHLYQQTTKRLGIHRKPLRLFQEIFRRMVPNNFATFYLARHEGQAVAGMVILKDHRMALAWQEGYRPEALSLNPVHLLLDRALEDACQEGIPLFNLGPTPEGREGIRQWKSHFGATTRFFTVLQRIPDHVRLVQGLRRLWPSNSPKRFPVD